MSIEKLHLLSIRYFFNYFDRHTNQINSKSNVLTKDAIRQQKRKKNKKISEFYRPEKSRTKQRFGEHSN
jgi:hypothetical protein